jgi:hypothetical protein
MSLSFSLGAGQDRLLVNEEHPPAMHKKHTRMKTQIFVYLVSTTLPQADGAWTLRNK